MRPVAIALAVLISLTVFVLPGTTMDTPDPLLDRVVVAESPVSPVFSLGITPRRYVPQEPRLVVKRTRPIGRAAEPPGSDAAVPTQASPASTPSQTMLGEPAAPPRSADLIASSTRCEAQAMSASSATLFASLNRERLERGIAALGTHPCGEHVAMLRARDLAERGYFAHVSPSGESAASLMRSLDVGYSNLGENLARNNYPADESVQVAFDSLMASDPHRTAILNPSFSYVGVASTEDATGMKYYVMIFLSA